MSKNDATILQLSSVSLGYIPGKELINAATGDVREGEMIALIGRNGTGKSTLLRTIAGIQSAISGDVVINDKSIDRYKANELASLLSFVSTAKMISENLSVFELVSIGRHPYTNWWGTLGAADKEKIVESIRFVGMEAHINSKVEQLSDGERQRVMIAVALAQDTRLILLDEPTAFLDIPNRIGIAEVLYKLRLSGKSILFSTHDFDSAFNYADKLWVLHDGKLIQGAPEDLGREKVFERIFEDSDVVFDEKNLRFKRNLLPEGNIYLHESEIAKSYWTVRALERIGYAVHSDKKIANAEISIATEGGLTTWIYNDKDNKISFQSLYELSRYLTILQ